MGKNHEITGGGGGQQSRDTVPVRKKGVKLDQTKEIPVSGACANLLENFE